MSRRLIFVDIASGILIVHMILWHCFQHAGLMQTCAYRMSNILYFFMPWFFYKAGVYHKSSPLSKCLKEGAKRLLVPFIVFTFIGYFAWVIHLYVIGDVSIESVLKNPIRQLIYGGSIDGNLALWFLPTLYFNRVIQTCCDKTRLNRWLYAAIFLIIIIITSYYKLDKPYYLYNTLAGQYFYTLGSLMKFKICEDYPHKRIILMICIFLYLSVVLFRLCSGDMRTTHGHLFSIWCICSLAGLTLFNSLINKLNLSLKFLQKLGENSMIFFVAHWIIIVLANVIFIDVLGFEKGWIYLLFLLIMLSIMLPLCYYLFKTPKFKWMVGSK